MQSEQTDTDSAWEQLAPLLDQAMARLSSADRNAIVLRYFENKNSRDVGVAMGINEAAAQKRVARAVEKLRSLCAKRGLVFPAVLLTTAISANAVKAAPAGVAASASALKGAGVSASTAALVKGTLNSLAWVKFKIAAAAALGVALAAGGVVLLEEMHSSRQAAFSERSLGSWLAKLDDGDHDNVLSLRWVRLRPAEGPAAGEAARQMGTNVWPSLIAMLDQKLSAGGGLLGGKQTPPSVIHHRAALALMEFGPQLTPLIPELERILNGNNSPKEAAMVLAAIGPEGWKVLTQTVSSTNDIASACAIWAIGSRGVFVPDETYEALKAKFVSDNPESINALTGWALAQIGQNKPEVVSLLMDGLKSKRADSRWGCAVALGCMGPDARAAVPALLEMVREDNPKIRHDAAQALEQIDPSAAQDAGVKGALATEHIPVTYPGGG